MMRSQAATAPSATDDLIAMLRRRGQRVTSQRVVILREIRRRAAHLTAEEVHRAVREELPGTSVPTVYATLELLVELGLVRKLDVGIGVSLYDGRTDPHQHAVCRSCGHLEDVEGDPALDSLLTAARDAGFRPEGCELVIFGLCRDCADSGADARPA